MSTALVFDVSKIESLARRVADLSDLDRDVLLDRLGFEVETQTRRRLSEEKTAPDGNPWPELSEKYKNSKAQKSSGGLLESAGGLIDSIQYLVPGNQVEIGSNLPYAAIHNFGGEVKNKGGKRTLHFRQNKRTGEVGNRFVKKRKSNFAQEVNVGAYSFDMQQREYLGFSGDNITDLQGVVDDFLNETLNDL